MHSFKQLAADQDSRSIKDQAYSIGFGNVKYFQEANRSVDFEHAQAEVRTLVDTSITAVTVADLVSFDSFHGFIISLPN